MFGLSYLELGLLLIAIYFLWGKLRGKKEDVDTNNNSNNRRRSGRSSNGDRRRLSSRSSSDTRSSTNSSDSGSRSGESSLIGEAGLKEALETGRVMTLSIKGEVRI